LDIQPALPVPPVASLRSASPGVIEIQPASGLMASDSIYESIDFSSSLFISSSYSL
jgi:hypothetical protein